MKDNDDMKDNEHEMPIVMYSTPDGVVKVKAVLRDETMWLAQAGLADLFGVAPQNITYHIKKIYGSGELVESATCKEILQVQNEGNREIARYLKFYNLDVAISVGYRVNSAKATQFRIWATNVLKEYLVKGFVLDDDRLKGNRSRYFRELLQRIRDIRMSERNFYQKVTDVFATSVDYDKSSDVTRTFFATVQNKFHYAAHRHTAAELIYERVDANKPMVGMMHFEGKYITEDDVKIAKNYLNDKELEYLRLLVSQFLDFAELQALEMKPMRMNDWVTNPMRFSRFPDGNCWPVRARFRMKRHAARRLPNFARIVAAR